MDKKKLITIAEFNEPVVAHMALAKLEALIDKSKSFASERL